MFGHMHVLAMLGTFTIIITRLANIVLTFRSFVCMTGVCLHDAGVGQQIPGLWKDLDDGQLPSTLFHTALVHPPATDQHFIDTTLMHSPALCKTRHSCAHQHSISTALAHQPALYIRHGSRALISTLLIMALVHSPAPYQARFSCTHQHSIRHGSRSLTSTL